MNQKDREVKEGTQYQGEDEQIVYSITSTPWGSSPTDTDITVKDVSDSYEDVTETVAPGSCSVDGDIVSTPKIKNLTNGHKYRVEVKFTVDGNVCEPYFFIVAQR